MTPEMRAWNQALGTGSRQVRVTSPITYALGTVGIPIPYWKRAIDLTGCIAALPFLGLCTLVMIALTRRLSPGPVFVRQERVGYMGRRFKIYKFRPVRVRTDCSIHRDSAHRNARSDAPKVRRRSHRHAPLIRWGSLLGVSGLAELPQLINVLRGEMSLVGPRPCSAGEFERYVSWQRQRCDALPGLTGLWQVSAKKRTTVEQKIRFDTKYARELSFWLDLKIIILTAPRLLAQIRETRRKEALRLSGIEQPAGEGTPPPSFKTVPAQSESLRHSTESLLDWLNELRRQSTRPKSADGITEKPSP